MDSESYKVAFIARAELLRYELGRKKREQIIDLGAVLFGVFILVMLVK